MRRPEQATLSWVQHRLAVGVHQSIVRWLKHVNRRDAEMVPDTDYRATSSEPWADVDLEIELRQMLDRVERPSGRTADAAGTVGQRRLRRSRAKRAGQPLHDTPKAA
jgi:DNA segregation ATPase FtsK/SpoIIIE-like protein